ncbi:MULTISPECIES: SDR family oxidoreductase [Variovorax]|jgi:short-subunit dehydrogenase|uniref:SDR family oxidoreductase n=1 Tax=Variovorax TaxID=34072 RepID=UPI00086CD8C8|nr:MULTISPECIES: SDR family oxidoreductase [Variovorax]MBN8755228.1 SDR family oxidoreductase [Variovorax sp.]ODU16016.1 MAG: short-chain dehydrogenase [Variovorax sp. SCN 67-85]ODV15697.1 MAG: short-chain dehydrogenase [Variovorax sp. SCN 67-20]OJZ14214.1 MAG: short-chain dehydrogenase [Variovorax sp. 67-131]UKI08384.1 SDR family oxidoreductase [Variovorax paradoxus]
MTTSTPLVFITGASSGIGQAMAASFYDAGYRLALVARRTTEIEAWAKSRGLSADRYRIYSADVAQTDSIVAAGNACIAQQGLPDVVIANAGISIGIDTAERSDLDVLSQTFATNNVGLAATFHPFVRAMVQRGSGRLVGIGSVASIRGLPGHGAYCASKAGVVAYCESLRGELHNSGVKVVTLCPGYIDTPLTQGNRYGMPFLMKAEDFAAQALRAIESGTSYRVIPWQMGVVAKIMRMLPNAVLDRAVQGRGRKKRSGEA